MCLGFYWRDRCRGHQSPRTHLKARRRTTYKIRRSTSSGRFHLGLDGNAPNVHCVSRTKKHKEVGWKMDVYQTSGSDRTSAERSCEPKCASFRRHVGVRRDVNYRLPSGVEIIDFRPYLMQIVHNVHPTSMTKHDSRKRSYLTKLKRPLDVEKVFAVVSNGDGRPQLMSHFIRRHD